jgi:hypothetical protein
LVIGISEAYAIARASKDNRQVGVDKEFGGTTEDFVRKNEKFFIKPEGILQFINSPHYSHFTKIYI